MEKASKTERLISMSINEAVETAPDALFGPLLVTPTVNHQRLGAILRSHRLQNRVQAKDVAEHMGLSKAQICFLEKGDRLWNLRLVTSYVEAVKELSE